MTDFHCISPDSILDLTLLTLVYTQLILTSSLVVYPVNSHRTVACEWKLPEQHTLRQRWGTMCDKHLSGFTWSTVNWVMSGKIKRSDTDTLCQFKERTAETKPNCIITSRSISVINLLKLWLLRKKVLLTFC